MMCPYRVECLARWGITKTTYRCGFEIASTTRSCPRAREQRQAQATASDGRMDTGELESGHRDHHAAGRSAPAVQLSLGV